MATSGKVREKVKGFLWNDELTRKFINMLLEYQTTYGRGQAFSWLELTAKFKESVGKKCGKETLKNKYGGMKQTWKDWKALKHGETCLGWDLEKGRVLADNDWWDKKTQENPDFRKFRKKGVPAKLEHLWDQLFDGTAPEGQYCIIPLIDPPPDTTMATQTGEGAGAGTDTTNIDLEYDDMIGVDINSNDPNISSNIRRGLSLPEGETVKTFPTPKEKRPMTMSSNSRAPKRKNGQSAGPSLLQQHLAVVAETSQKMLAMWEAEASSAAASAKPQDRTQEVMDVIEQMITDGLLVEGSPLWCFSVTALVKEDLRSMFLAIPRNSARLSLLQWQFHNNGAKT